MKIEIHDANIHNLKNFSVDIPMYSLTAITGVSGSGKSTVLRDVLAATGALRFTQTSSKTIRDALRISNFINAKVSNLPQTVYIGGKKNLGNIQSSVSTISGIHDIARTIFSLYSECRCNKCGNIINGGLSKDYTFEADISNDGDRYIRFLEFAKKNARLVSESFFDKKYNKVKRTSKRALLFQVVFHLYNPTVGLIHTINKMFGCRVRVKCPYEFDPVLFSVCDHCGKLNPLLSRSRFSFNKRFDEGGGACRKCAGNGKIITIEQRDLVVDKSKSVMGGGIRFVSEKGVQYTNINGNVLKLALKKFGINIKEPISKIKDESIQKVFYGDGELLEVKKGGIVKKSFVFRGIIGELIANRLKGKGEKTLGGYCHEYKCPNCNGTGIDSEISCFSIAGYTFSDVMLMSFTDMEKFYKDAVKMGNKIITKNIERMHGKTNLFNRVSCGHLQLYRRTNTLSGGEFQRIQICAVVNSNIDELCYLLDEPSVGLHPDDLTKLGLLFHEIVKRKNTIIMVEHNPVLLQFCNWIFEIGPCGGPGGGNLILSDFFRNIGKYSTPTACLFTPNENSRHRLADFQKPRKWISFEHLTENNLKNISVKIPCERFTVICGISGSGKSTLARDVILKRVQAMPSVFGFQNVLYIGQASPGTPWTSTVGSLLKISDKVAKIYASCGHVNEKCFSLTWAEGKCPICHGRGRIWSEYKENLGFCDSCNGTGFEDELLQIKYGGITFSEFIRMPFSKLISKKEFHGFSKLAETCCALGLGHLSLSRRSSTLSRGEIQRVRLVTALLENKRNSLIILDEPSIGLHVSDSRKLVDAIIRLTKMANTVIVVEHNLSLIREADYVIELGGTGLKGGRLLYAGLPWEMVGTPTSEALKKGKLFKQDCGLLNNDEGKHTPIVFQTDSEKLSFPRFTVCQVPEAKESLESISKSVCRDFVSFLIPGNIIFSKPRINDRCILHAVPVQLVDFVQGLHEPVSVYSALGMKNFIIPCVMEVYPSKSAIAQFLFDEESLTGKCFLCKGCGSIDFVDIKHFLEQGKLSADCIHFLQRCFPLIRDENETKKIIGVNIFKPYDKMNDTERKILLFGCSREKDYGGAIFRWRGLIPTFLMNHAHYPDIELSKKILGGKENRRCPLCLGKMLVDEYKDITLLGLGYSDFMSMPFCELQEQFRKKQRLMGCISKLGKVIDLAVAMGLENVAPRTTLNMLDANDSAVVKLISIYLNRIQNSCVVLANSQAYGQMGKTAKTIIDSISKTNTVVFI